MSEIKHTPGPWTFDPDGGLPVIQMYCADNKHVFHGSRSDEEQIANALLCCAAPELLEALRLCYDHCRLYYPEVEHNNVGETVRAAISKVTGAQPC